MRQAIVIILSTNPGERVMRPDFGAGLDRFVFEPVNAATIAQLRTRVRDALVAWEPRIDVLEVDVTPQGDPPVVLLVEMSYRVRATNALQNLVYPFYLQEAGRAAPRACSTCATRRSSPTLLHGARAAATCPSGSRRERGAEVALVQIVAR